MSFEETIGTAGPKAFFHQEKCAKILNSAPPYDIDDEKKNRKAGTLSETAERMKKNA